MQELTVAEARALDEVDLTSMVRDLEELVAIPSVTGTAAESECQQWVARRMEELGLDVDHWSMDVEALKASPGFPGFEAEREEAWGLVGITAGSGGEIPNLVLQGHVDVVPPGDLDRWPMRDPWAPRIEDGVMFGRGTCDMKSGVVTNLAALGAVNRAGVKLAGRVAIHSVVGEEDGGLGAFGTLARGHSGGACIITEPTSGTVITANGGALTFRIKVSGLATHAATRYTGQSAFEAFLPLHQALGVLERERNANANDLMSEYPIAYPLSIGIVRTGDWASSVPDLLVAEGRLGVAIDEDPDEARAALMEAVADACGSDPWLRENPATVEWSGGQFASGRLPAGHPLLALVQSCHADANGVDSPRERGAPYGSDLRLYAGAGIPSLHLGPGDVSVAHGPLEQVPLAELESVCRTLVLAILRTCGADGRLDGSAKGS